VKWSRARAAQVSVLGIYCRGLVVSTQWSKDQVSNDGWSGISREQVAGVQEQDLLPRGARTTPVGIVGRGEGANSLATDTKRQ